MRNFILGLILGLCITSAFAGKINAPPPLPDTNPSLQAYLNEVYVNFHRLEIVDTSPDGSRYGKKGDMILYISGTTYRIYLNVDSSTTWKYAVLS